MTLLEALPELFHDVSSSLIREGRGRVADQLRDLQLVSWAFDDFAQLTYLRFTETAGPGNVEETISFHDDMGVNVNLDQAGTVIELEVTGYEDVLSRLGGDSPGPPA